MEKYVLLRSISGLSKNWLKDIERVLNKYLNAVNWEIEEVKTLEYIKRLQNLYNNCGFRKMVYQIRKFLQHLKIDFADSIQPPKEQEYTPVRITSEDIKKTLDYFKEHERRLQIYALIHLGIDSFARAEELYQLELQDINLNERKINIIHNPDIERHTKNKKTRVCFFTEKTAQILKKCLDFYNNGWGYYKLFSERVLQKAFRNAPIRVKHLRKYASSEWSRKGGSSSVKKLLMGRSTRNDIDFQHYCNLTESELRNVYDKVMGVTPQ